MRSPSGSTCTVNHERELVSPNATAGISSARSRSATRWHVLGILKLSGAASAFCATSRSGRPGVSLRSMPLCRDAGAFAYSARISSGAEPSAWKIITPNGSASISRLNLRSSASSLRIRSTSSLEPPSWPSRPIPHRRRYRAAAHPATLSHG